MNMWMIEPAGMCNKHLVGEHGELHKFLHNWRKKHSITGRIASNTIQPLAYKDRHDALAEEMLGRGLNHASSLDQPDFSYLPEHERNAQVDVGRSTLKLIDRCEACRERVVDLQNPQNLLDTTHSAC